MVDAMLMCGSPKSASQGSESSMLLSNPTFLRTGSGKQAVPTITQMAALMLRLYLFQPLVLKGLRRRVSLKAVACQETNAGIDIEILQVKLQKAKGPLEGQWWLI